MRIDLVRIVLVGVDLVTESYSHGQAVTKLYCPKPRFQLFNVARNIEKLGMGLGTRLPLGVQNSDF